MGPPKYSLLHLKWLTTDNQRYVGLFQLQQISDYDVLQSLHTMNACLLATLALKCQSVAAKGNTHPKVWILNAISANMGNNGFYPL